MMDLMLTEKQIRVLRYFRDYRRERGIAPTLDEAARALGVSKITIHEHLNQLSRKGAIHRDRAKARAVAILYDPDRVDTVPNEVDQDPEYGDEYGDVVEPSESAGSRRRASGISGSHRRIPRAAADHRVPSVPLIGTIAAGSPIEALEDREDLSLTDLVPTGEGIYLLRVRGKSMIEDHIDDGDLVVVERRETAKDGDIVVAILEDEQATLKRFYREPNGMIRLQPANAEMAPLYTSHVEVRGVVRGVIRKFR